MFNVPTTINPTTFFPPSKPLKPQRPPAAAPALKFDETLALGETTYDLVETSDGTTKAITNEYDLAQLVMQIGKFAGQLAKSKETLFSTRTNRFNGKKIIHSKQLGKRFLLLFNADIEGIFRHFPAHHFDPHFSAVIDALSNRKLANVAPVMHTLPDSEIVRLVDTLNGCVTAIRDKVNSAAFKANVRNFRRSADKNTKELLKYIRLLFRDHSRLLVLRIDLGYRKEFCNGIQKTSDISLADVKQHWAKLLKHLDKLLPEKSKIGFARKIEFALLKSHHIHLMLFLDGSIVREDITLARLVGEAWMSEEITGGRGIYFNCNAKKDQYTHLGIGMVAHDDLERRRGLEIAAQYLTKPDYYIKLAEQTVGQVFAKGNMPKPKPSRLGRPRKNAKTLAECNVAEAAAA